MQNPYKSQPARAFWRQAVAERHFADLEALWDPMPLRRTDRIATAGSCFAQHIGNNLARRGARFLDLEPAPPVFATEAEARRFGFGVFSCRYGNIYTTRQLLQLFREAFGDWQPAEIVWEKAGRYFDALRPGITPVGEPGAEDVLSGRRAHLQAVREMFTTVDVFVFTLGLTEGWAHKGNGTMFPTAPGTIAGTYRPEDHVFHNLTYPEIMADMIEFHRLLKAVNPGVRLLLTVSPVPLMATATAGHVLVATCYSKSVLRAVAGDLAQQFEDVFYFPSYEIISSPALRGIFFNPDLRNVNEMGVNLVMTHFFSGDLGREFGTAPATQDGDGGLDLICDEARIAEGL